jgi:phosphoserine aminotransferase
VARKFNFYAGPSTLPLSVLEELQSELVDYKGMGLSLVETSHRSKEYDEVHYGAISKVKSLFGLPDNYKVMFIQGGATMQFSMIPMNLLGPGKSCDIINSGAWAKKAIADAKMYGDVRVIYDGKENNFTSLPDPSAVKTSPGAEYLHLTSNETIGGVQWKTFPKTEAPLVADMSSDIMSRPLPVEQFGMIYAGAQKNLGPAGVTLVIMRDDLIEKANQNLGAYLKYSTHAESDSLYNTPPVFSIYALNKVLGWIEGQGGLAGIEKKNQEKAKVVYDAIESAKGFYKCPVDPAVRSDMNIVFTLANPELDKEFLAGTAERGMLGLKGHRSVGGFRASLYNAMPIEGAQALSQYMAEFAKKNG